MLRALLAILLLPSSVLADAGAPVPVLPPDDPNSDQEWIARYDPPGGRSDYPAGGVASSSRGFVFVAGSSHGLLDVEIVVLAYSAKTGELRWSTRLPRGDGTQAASVAVSPDGTRVYVTGRLWRRDGEQDAITAALSSETGEPVWIARDRGLEQVGRIVVSPDGKRVFIAGRTDNGVTTIAYSAPRGKKQWIQRYRERRTFFDYYPWLALTPDRKHVITSLSEYEGYGYRLLSYRARDGVREWKLSRDAGSVEGLAVSPDGRRVFVTGAHDEQATFITTAYSVNTGKQQWSHEWEEDSVASFEVVVSPDSSTVYHTGLSYKDGDRSTLTVAYDAKRGLRRWSAVHPVSPTIRESSAHSITITPNGARVYVGGEAGQTNQADFDVVAYEALTGQFLWCATYDSRLGADHVSDLTISRNGARLFVTGSTENANAITTIAYDAKALSPESC